MFEPIDLKHLVAQCIQVAAPKYTGNIEFDTKIEEAVVRNADEKTLTLAIMNLIENAIKYAKDTPSIVVRLAMNKDNNYCLEVADFGQGIPKTEREHIFDKFYRVGNEDTRKTKGTGLGLYIAKEIIKAHKGQISVRSNQPKGTVFSIVLPNI
jgi:signal transduction histidine kinase